MPHIYADRVKELTASTGPGAIALSGAAEGGYRTFATGIGVGNATDICIRDPATGEWETCETTLLTGTSLSRGPLHASSTGGRISFAAGTKEVFVCLPGTEAMRRSEIEAELGALSDAVSALSSALGGKAAIASPALTGAPTAPTPAAGDNDTSIATTAFVQTALAAAKPSAIVAGTGTTLGPTLAQAESYFLCTNAAGCAVTIPTNAAQAFPVGTHLTFEQGAAGALTFAGAGGVTIHVAATHLAATVDQYAVVQLLKVAADTWTLFGNLELA